MTSMPSPISKPVEPTAVGPTQQPAIYTQIPTMLTTQPPLPTSEWHNLLAYYELDGTTKDLLNNYAPINIGTSGFSDGGVYCDGVQYGCVETQPIGGLNYQNFSISADFKVTEYPLFPTPLFVAGKYTRGFGFYLFSDVRVGLVECNDLYECPGKPGIYSLNIWHNAQASYDGHIGTIYLDSEAICTATFSINTNQGFGDEDKIISTSHYGSGVTYKGFIKNLKIYDVVILP